MKNKITITGLALAAMLLCGGCFPYHYTSAPGVKGRIVDARTRAPIAKAQATVSVHGLKRSGIPTRTAATGADGAFLITPVQYWGLWTPFTPESGRWFMQVNATAPGYAPAEASNSVGSNSGPAMTDLGTISLKKKKNNTL